MQEIDISEQIRSFKEHLKPDENIRIVVSGTFGCGKTYFLKRFFGDNKEFNVIKIFPVNYSVAKNEDIFKLIKFDVLFELLNNPDVVFDKEYFDRLSTGQIFAEQNALDIVKPLIEFIPKIGKSLLEGINKIIEFAKKYDSFHKKVQIDKQADALDYIKNIKEAINSIEEDSITELIRTSVESLSKDNKKTILLIDDLDRIDPDHIFRILNVFSCHFDVASDENKFFFDKIILVCDIENIRAIFHNRYGTSVDFSGYIDKFYTRNIFRFNNNANIEKFVEECVQSIQFNDITMTALGIEKRTLQYSFLINILKDLLSRHYINLRKLINLKNIRYAKGDNAYETKKYSLNRRNYPLIAIVELLIIILESKKLLLIAIDDLQNFVTSLESQSYDFLALIIPILDIEQNRLGDKEYKFKDDDGIIFSYQIKYTNYGFYLANITPIAKSIEDENNFTFHQPNVLKYFHQLIKKLDNYKII